MATVEHNREVDREVDRQVDRQEDLERPVGRPVERQYVESKTQELVDPPGYKSPLLDAKREPVQQKESRRAKGKMTIVAVISLALLIAYVVPDWFSGRR
jgi:hypothetical protein